MEGISSEAASLAGHLKLSNLCWIYDDNKITIEGDTDLAFSEDVAKRFEGFGWQVLQVDDANDLDALRAAVRQFAEEDQRPTLIKTRSIIGYGAPHKQNSHDAHGAPLGEEEVRLTKEAYGWPPDEHFLVPDEVRRHFEQGIQRRGQALHARWQVSAYSTGWSSTWTARRLSAGLSEGPQGDRPGAQHAPELDAEVVVQAPGRVFLDAEEARLRPLGSLLGRRHLRRPIAAPEGLGGGPGRALLAVLPQTLGCRAVVALRLVGHDSAPGAPELCAFR